MVSRENGFRKVATGHVILGLIMLAGVLSMAIGYFGGNASVLYAGIGVTILGALNGVIFIVAKPTDHRFIRHPSR